MQKKLTKINILIAPLDWGLGHATRCIPIIKSLLEKGFNIFIATDGEQSALLEKEFPTLTFLKLKGYQIKYSKQGFFMPLYMFLQTPELLFRIKQENSWLKKTVQKHKINIIISDNRYGLYHDNIPCIFITHQLTIKAKFNWIEFFIQKLNYQFINRFTTCWVPDIEENNGIAGLLSHPSKMPDIPVNYIGLLSRFPPSSATKINYDYCILLSGPEPQRTILENKILSTSNQTKKSIIIVRGKPASNEIIEVPSNVTIFNHLEQQLLFDVIASSEIIISRSGYTTVMELLTMQKKSILIPTPGQTEQEYLAKFLFNKKWCYSVPQKKLLLGKAIQEAANFDFQFPKCFTTNFTENINMLIQQLIA